MNIQKLLKDAIIPKDIGAMQPKTLTSRIDEIDNQTLFFLTEGVSYDKRRLLPFILAKKPMAIVARKEDARALPNAAFIYHDNPRKALSHALFHFYGLDKMKTRLIAVTGTNGKTTTATMLFEILRSAKKGVGFIGTGRIQINDRSLSFPYYSMTTPDPELLYPILSKMNQENLEFAVMEASSHALTLEKLSPLSFEIGIFTNLSEEHLDYHKSMEDYYLAKARLFENTSLALINTDDVYGRRLSRELESKSVQTFGALYNADVTATNVQGTDTFRSRYTYKAETLSFSVELSLPGIYQIYNSLPAISAAIALGISPHEAQRAIEIGRAHV